MRRALAVSRTPLPRFVAGRSPHFASSWRKGNGFGKTNSDPSDDVTWKPDEALSWQSSCIAAAPRASHFNQNERNWKTDLLEWRARWVRCIVCWHWNNSRHAFLQKKLRLCKQTTGMRQCEAFSCFNLQQKCLAFSEQRLEQNLSQ